MWSVLCQRLRGSEVAIEVRVIGCNFSDILITRGSYQIKPTLPFAPGSEVSGIVTDVGKDVSHVKRGDHVVAFLKWGGFATHVCVEGFRVFKFQHL